MKLEIVLAITALATSGSAFAQTATPEMRAVMDAITKSCAADAKTLCDGKTAGGLNTCLRENIDKASASCKDAMSKMPVMPAGMAAMAKACAADAKTLCDGKIGPEQNMCLRENTAKVSAPCNEAMSKVPAGDPARPAQ